MLTHVMSSTKRHRGDEHDQRAAHLAHDRIANRQHGRVVPRRVIGIRVGKPRRHTGRLSPELLRRHARLETRDDGKEARAAHASDVVRPEIRQWNPRVERLRRRVGELGTHDPDDRVRFAAQRDGPVEDSGIAAEPALPQAISDHHGAARARPDALPRRAHVRGAGCGRSVSKKPGVTSAADKRSGAPLPVRSTPLCPSTKKNPPIDSASRVAARKSRKSGSEYGPCLDAVGGIRVPHPDEAVGRRERERIEQDAAHDAEDRGVCADAQRQRREGDDGKSGRRAEPAERVAQILFELVGDGHATFLSLAPKVFGAAIVFREFEISEPASRFGVGLVGRPALALESRRQGLEVEGKLLVDLGGDSRA